MHTVGAIKDGNTSAETPPNNNMYFSFIRPACAGQESILEQCNLNLPCDGCSNYRWVKCLEGKYLNQIIADYMVYIIIVICS